MKTILVTTYAVNPLKGSEDGMGWNFVNQIARYNKVIAVTRENNREHIQKFMCDHPSELYVNIHFLYFDTPKWTRFWKKGSRGAMLYYWMWQKNVVAFIRKQKIEFDVVHNLNFHNDWTPSYLWKLGKPFVWGPVGHHPLIPAQYLHPFSVKYLIKDRITWLVKKYFWNCSNSLNNTRKHANAVWCMNSSVPKVLNLKHTLNFIEPSVATEDFGWNPDTKKETFTLLTAGRLVPLKGFDLSILAFSFFLKSLSDDQKKRCELLIVGSGPEVRFLKDLVKKEKIQDYVRFIDWIARKELLEIFKTSSAFLFPSHEGAGMVVPEALSFGLPVICLDNIGPGEFINDKCGFAVSMNDYHTTVVALGNAIQQLHENPDLLFEMSHNARLRFEDKFNWNKRGDLLNDIYSKL